jgi:hypothetical protein
MLWRSGCSKRYPNSIMLAAELQYGSGRAFEDAEHQQANRYAFHCELPRKVSDKGK